MAINISKLAGTLQKKFGAESVLTLKEGRNLRGTVKTWISTGNILLDTLIGGGLPGGIPVGRLTEIFGGEGCGKSTLMQHIMIQAQKAGALPILFDTESATDLKRCRRMGMDTEEILFEQPETIEQATKMIEHTVNEARKMSGGAPIVIGVDSVAAMESKEEAEADAEERRIGAAARAFSSMLKRTVKIISKHQVALVFVNQTRAKIGVAFGSTENTTGGNAIKFYSSVRLGMYKRKALKKGEDVFGIETRIKVIKNKIANPFGNCDIIVRFDKGIDKYDGYFKLGVKLGLIEQPTKGWWSYKGNRFREREFVDFLRKGDNKKLLKRIRKKMQNV